MPKKTQIIWFGTRQQLAKRDLTSLASISLLLVSCDSVRDLGVLLNSELTMDADIRQLCRSCFYQLRRLRVIRPCLSRRSLLTLACAFICNRIDYCNGVLCGVTAGRLDRLQSVLIRYGATRPQHSKVLTHLSGHPWWASLASSPVSLSVQNLYPRAKQHCRFVAALATGTLPPCRLRVGSSASSICWPKWPPSSAVSYRELVDCAVSQFQDRDSKEHTALWHSTISRKLEPFTKINLFNVFVWIATASLVPLRILITSGVLLNALVTLHYTTRITVLYLNIMLTSYNIENWGFVEIIRKMVDIHSRRHDDDPVQNKNLYNKYI